MNDAPELNASNVWHRRDELADPQMVNRVAANLVIDDKFAAVNIGIVLRDSGFLQAASAVFERIIDIDPVYFHAHYENSLALTYADSHLKALHNARKAAELRPNMLRYVLNWVGLLADAGDAERAKRELNRYVAASITELPDIVAAQQFSTYLDLFPRSMLDHTISEIVSTPTYCTDEAVATAILKAAREKSSFSLLRLGDGEGAWMFIENSDEAQFCQLYRMNRVSFLKDWFGADDLLHSNEFHLYSRVIDDIVRDADIVGIPDPARITHEYRILSHRGIPSTVNILRKLGLLQASSGTEKHYTSSSVHIHLDRMHFFAELFQHPGPFGMITSYKDLPRMLRHQAGIDIRYEFLVPGDSRNVWLADDGHPLIQFPATAARVSSELAALDLEGVVFLVAAGYVGKQYLRVIKQQGGIAIDIGGVSNTWARRGLTPGS